VFCFLWENRKVRENKKDVFDFELFKNIFPKSSKSKFLELK